MTTLLYDESFEGLLTAVFLIFEQRFEHAEIIKNASYTGFNRPRKSGSRIETLVHTNWS